MPTLNDWQMDSVNPEDLSATDLREECAAAEAAGDTEIHCCRLIKLEEHPFPEHAQMVYFPGYHRAGIAWGADARWTDCTSAEDAVRRWDADEMVE